MSEALSALNVEQLNSALSILSQSSNLMILSEPHPSNIVANSERISSVQIPVLPLNISGSRTIADRTPQPLTADRMVNETQPVTLSGIPPISVSQSLLFRGSHSLTAVRRPQPIAIRAAPPIIAPTSHSLDNGTAHLTNQSMATESHPVPIVITQPLACTTSLQSGGTQSLSCISSVNPPSAGGPQLMPATVSMHAAPTSNSQGHPIMLSWNVTEGKQLVLTDKTGATYQFPLPMASADSRIPPGNDGPVNPILQLHPGFLSESTVSQPHSQSMAEANVPLQPHSESVDHRQTTAVSPVSVQLLNSVVSSLGSGSPTTMLRHLVAQDCQQFIQHHGSQQDSISNTAINHYNAAVLEHAIPAHIVTSPVRLVTSNATVSSENITSPVTMISGCDSHISTSLLNQCRTSPVTPSSSMSNHDSMNALCLAAQIPDVGGSVSDRCPTIAEKVDGGASTVYALANMSMVDLHGFDVSLDKTVQLHEEKVVQETALIPGLPFATHYCVECNVSYSEQCSEHDTDYTHVPDTVVLSHARLSLPTGLQLQQSSAAPTNKAPGVWSVRKIPQKVRFGPLIGHLSSDRDDGKYQTEGAVTSWKVFYENTFCLLEMLDECVCNWMMFVKLAQSPHDQNMLAHQKDKDIYFITCRDIEPNEELLVWYSKEMALLMDVPLKPGMTNDCSVCGQHFHDSKALSMHNRQVHPDLTPRKWKCQLCARGFLSATKLQTHMLGHIGIKPHKCKQCGKQFTDQSNLRIHKLIHSDEKKFKCTECDRSFRQKAHLTTHKLTHTGEKNITCQYCNQKFARQSDFKQHEYRHTRALIYKCEQCGKEFFKQQNYKKHLLIHDGCRDFGCSLCSKSFASNYHLKRHKQKCKGVKKGQTLILNSDDVTLEDVAMASDTLARPSARESMASDTLARPSVRDSNKRKLYNCLFE